jgi:hypothetical protein
MRIRAPIGFSMKFTPILDELVNRIDQSAKLSDLKAYIMSVYEQAEAADEEKDSPTADLAEELAHYKNLYAEEAYEVANLKSAHANAVAQLEASHSAQLSAFQQQIQQLQAKNQKPATGPFKDEAKAVLIQLFNAGGEWVKESALMRASGRAIGVLQFHIDWLLESELIESPSAWTEMAYRIAPAGRKAVMANGWAG